jgi:hypothetical protein
MKIKKINLYRPEIEVKFNRPILARLYLVLVFYRFVMIKRLKLNIFITSKIMKNAGHVTIKKCWYIVIPKIKVVDAL